MSESEFSLKRCSLPILTPSVPTLHSSGGAEEGPVADAEGEGAGSGCSPTGCPGRRRRRRPQPAATYSGAHAQHRLATPPHHDSRLLTQEETGGGEGDCDVGQVQEEEDDLNDEHKGEQEGHEALLHLQDALRRDKV